MSGVTGMMILFTDKRVLNERCYWNDDCVVDYSWCFIHTQGLLDTNLTCQCRTNYREVDGTCKAGEY